MVVRKPPHKKWWLDFQGFVSDCIIILGRSVLELVKLHCAFLFQHIGPMFFAIGDMEKGFT